MGGFQGEGAEGVGGYQFAVVVKIEGGVVDDAFIDEAFAGEVVEDFPTAFDEEAGDAALAEVFEDVGPGFFPVDQGLGGLGIAAEVEVGRDFARAGDDDAEGLAGRRGGGAADGEPGVVAAGGFGADEDGVAAGAEAVHIAEGGGGAEPLVAVGAGEFAVEGKGGFADDPGFSGGDPVVERTVEGGGFPGEDAGGDGDAFFSEEAVGPAGVGGVGVGGADDDAGDAGREDGVGAGRGAAVCAAGFEGDVEGGAFRGMSVAGGVAEGGDFGVGSPGASVPALADDFSAFDEQGADAGIGIRASEALGREGKGAPHEGGVFGALLHGFSKAGKGRFTTENAEDTEGVGGVGGRRKAFLTTNGHEWTLIRVHQGNREQKTANGKQEQGTGGG